MFEQTSRLAEKLASSVSRRGFLGSLGGWAAAAAMGVAGVLTGAGTAQASFKRTCCYYAPDSSCGACPLICYKCLKGVTSCPANNNGLTFCGLELASTCKDCGFTNFDGCLGLRAC